MKKILTSVVAMFVAVGAFAQIGISAGLTSASANVETAINEVKGKLINQYHVGITYKIGIGNIFAIQPSILYNVKGSHFDVENIKDTSLDFKTGFVEVPVQLQAGLGIGSLVRIYGLAEPFVGYAVANEVTTKTILNAAGDTQKTWDNVKNKLEYGLSLGAGVEIFKHFQLSVKYFWTFSDLYGASDATWNNIVSGIGNINAKNVNGISATLTVLF